ncbi:MAG: DNA polymerase IV [Eubacteriaceae bacterium]|nr:DNA polymerase IV [Eubacteriaceae bacterium]
MSRIIIAVDMDAFFPSVEARDNPKLQGAPLVIGALPGERGVVASCSYEARKYGVRSAMPISEAFRRCPGAVYMRPDFKKYEQASKQVHRIWQQYSPQIEYVALDEAYLDITSSATLFGGAWAIGNRIRQEVADIARLSCSVGIGYSMMSAKLASEENKPGGLFEIPSPAALKALIANRSARVMYGIGPRTATKLESIGVVAVQDILEKQDSVIALLGSYGKTIVDLASGIDNRVVAGRDSALSLGKETTFQKDITDFSVLKDSLRVFSRELAFQLHEKGLYCRSVTIKITYGTMRKITRSKRGEATNSASYIYKQAESLLDHVNQEPVRLVGLSLGSLSDFAAKQMSFFEMDSSQQLEKAENAMFKIQQKHGMDILKTGSELAAEQQLRLRSTEGEGR